MAVPEDSKNIIKKLIAHLNALEGKINLLKEGIDETNDLVTVNKLDIINLKNEIEKIKLSIPEVSPDTLTKLREQEKLSGSTGQIEKWKRMEKDIEDLRNMIERGGPKNIAEITSAMELLNQRVRKLESAEALKKHTEHTKAIEGLSKRVEAVEKKAEKIRHCPRCGSPAKLNAKFCSKCGKRL